MVAVLAPPQLGIPGLLLWNLPCLPLPSDRLLPGILICSPHSSLWLLLISSPPSVSFLVFAEHERPSLKVPNA